MGRISNIGGEDIAINAFIQGIYTEKEQTLSCNINHGDKGYNKRYLNTAIACDKPFFSVSSHICTEDCYQDTMEIDRVSCKSFIKAYSY